MKKSILVLFAGALLSACSGSRPIHLGSINQDLTACPAKPNCVSSLAPKNDTNHYIAPINVAHKQNTKEQLIHVITNDEQAELIVESPNYIYAEYSSKLMGFIDDVEFLFGKEPNVIHVRSASRLGYRDFGVNRERIESIRTELE